MFPYRKHCEFLFHFAKIESIKRITLLKIEIFRKYFKHINREVAKLLHQHRRRKNYFEKKNKGYIYLD